MTVDSGLRRLYRVNWMFWITVCFFSSISVGEEFSTHQGFGISLSGCLYRKEISGMSQTLLLSVSSLAFSLYYIQSLDSSYTVYFKQWNMSKNRLPTSTWIRAFNAMCSLIFLADGFFYLVNFVFDFFVFGFRLCFVLVFLFVFAGCVKIPVCCVFHFFTVRFRGF